MSTLSVTELTLIMLGMVILGGIVGYALAASRARSEAGGRSPAELKRDMEALREEHQAYRASVDGHFAKTGELLNGLTTQYREVYAHIASGAQTLCDTDPTRLSEQLPLPAATETPGLESAAQASDEASQPESENASAEQDAVATAADVAAAEIGAGGELTDVDVSAVDDSAVDDEGAPDSEAITVVGATAANDSDPHTDQSDEATGADAASGVASAEALTSEDDEPETAAGDDDEAGGRKDVVGRAA